MDTTVNMRSKRTETEQNALIAMWSERRKKIDIRKKYELEVEKDNEKTKEEIVKILNPVAESLSTPFEFIIESNRCVIQKRIHSIPKAPGAYVTTVSQSIGSLDGYMKDAKGLKMLAAAVRHTLRRMNALTKKCAGKTLHPLIATPTRRVNDNIRKPEGPMVIVTLNVRTRYDF